MRRKLRSIGAGQNKHEFERELLDMIHPISAHCWPKVEIHTALVEGILYQDHPKDSDPFSKLALLCLSYKSAG